MRTLVLAVALSAAASGGQISVPSGFGFANACAGNQYFGSMPNPGDGFSTITDSFMTCNTAVAAIAAVNAANTGVWFGHPWDNSADAFASPGLIQVEASNNGSNAAGFPGAAAYGGWNETITISGAESGAGVWLAPLTVHGNLLANGSGALTRMGVNAYQNHNFLQPYGNAVNAFAYNLFLSSNGGPSGVRNPVILFSWDYQGAWFGADSGLTNYAINRTIYFAFPFTWNTPFDIGIYLGGVAGEGASGPDTTQNSTFFDFAHTITWGGAGLVYDPNTSNTTSNYTIQSGSGFNYNVPYATPVPEPAPLGLAGLGTVVLFARRRRR